MTSADLAKLDPAGLPAWTRPWAQYSLAVEYLRDREYHKAADALRAFIDTYESAQPQLFEHEDGRLLVWQSDYPFWQQVKEQLALSIQVAKLQDRVIQRSKGTQPPYFYDPLAATVPIQKLAEQDWQLSAYIKEWINQHQNIPGQYTIRDGEWLYAYLVPAPGKHGYLYLESALDHATFLYEETTPPPSSWNKEKSAVLVRVPYRFVAHTPVSWKAIGNS